MNSNRFILFLILFLSVVNNSFSQLLSNGSLKWSESRPMAGKNNVLANQKLLCYDNNEFVILYNVARTIDGYERDWIVDTYFAKMNLDTDKIEHLKLNLNSQGIKRDWHRIKTINDGVYIFSTAQDKEDQSFKFYVETVLKSPLKYADDLREIGKVKYDKDKLGSQLTNFTIIDSPNEKQLLLSYAMVKGDLRTNLGLQLLDKNLKEIWKKEITLPQMATKDIKLDNYCMDNNGNVYLIQNKTDKKNKVNELYLTGVTVDDHDALVEKIMMDEDRYPLSAKLFIDNNGKLICFGVFTIKGSESALGTYSITYDCDIKNVLHKEFVSFDDAFLTKGLSDKEAKKLLVNKDKNKDFNNKFIYHIRTPFLRTDGGYSIILENRKTETKKPLNSNSGVSDTQFYCYNDIMVFTYDSKGALRWMQKIPKVQRLKSADSLFGSYFASIDSLDHIYIILNENTEDKMSDKAEPVVITLDTKGEMRANKIFESDKEVRQSFAPSLTHQLSSNKYLLGRIDLSWKGSPIQWSVADLK